MNKFTVSILVAILANTLILQAQVYVPPVGVCALCDEPAVMVNGQWTLPNHKSWCPYYVPPQSSRQDNSSNSSNSNSYSDYTPAPSVSQSKPSSPSTASIVAGTLAPILAEALVSDLLSTEFDFGFDGKQTFSASGDGKSNGKYVVVRDERSDGVGIYDNSRHKWLIKPLKYSQLDISDLEAVVAQLYKNGKWGMIDANDKGKVLIPFDYQSAESLGPGGVKVFYDEKGKEGPCHIYKPVDTSHGTEWEEVQGEFTGAKSYKKSRQVLVVEQDGKKGVMYNNGAYAVEPAWEDVIPAYDIMDQEVYLTRITTGWGLQYGQAVVLPNVYESITVDTDPNYILVQKGGKKGVMNIRGKKVIDTVFDKISKYSSKTSTQKDKKYIQVESGGKYGLYTEDGVMAVPLVCDSEKDLGLRAQTCEQDSYTQFVWRKIKSLGSTKGEFETTADFEARQKDAALQEAYLNANLGDTEKEFIDGTLNRITQNHSKPVSLTLSNYDADKQCFWVYCNATKYHNPYKLSVPVSEAPRFKEEFPSMTAKAIADAKYTIKMDTIALESMGFTTSDGKLYWLTK